ncbi:hypothetical protein ACEPPN_003994 [Leptodophora sp. 'Broadleaf-Isolate-01']
MSQYCTTFPPPLNWKHRDLLLANHTRMATIETGNHSALLEEWIDGTTIHRSWKEGHNEGTATGFLFGFYEHLLKLLSTTTPVASRAILSMRKVDIRLLKEAIGSFFVWGDGFRDGSLELIAENSDDLKELVIASFITMSRVLLSRLVPICLPFALAPEKDEILSLVDELEVLMDKARIMTDESDYDSDESAFSNTDDPAWNDEKASEGVSLLVASVKGLTDTVPSMERTLSYIAKWQKDQQAVACIDFQISGPARIYARKVHGQYSKANTRLVERLGEANWQRHTALRSGRLSEEQATATITGAGVPKSLFTPASMLHDSGLGSSVGLQTNYAATAVSHSSFISNITGAEKGRLRVPSTPKQVIDGISFTCEFCGNLLRGIKNRVDWKRHVFADIKPYICTFSGCNEELVSFPTRKISNASEEELRAHILQDHGQAITDVQFQTVARVGQERLQLPIESQECPLCLCIPGKSRRNFVTHVSNHLEDIALAVLPRDDASDSDDDQDSSRSKGTSSDAAAKLPATSADVEDAVPKQVPKKTQRKREREAPERTKFYRNGLPSEVIVIDDSPSPEPQLTN